MINLEHFLEMGGYAAYVWSAYGLAAVVLLGNFFYTRRLKKHALKQLKRRYQWSADES